MSLGEWGQVQEEMNSHWHKTVYNKSSTVQWYDGILHPQESQREGKKDRNKDVGAVSYS